MATIQLNTISRTPNLRRHSPTNARVPGSTGGVLASMATAATGPLLEHERRRLRMDLDSIDTQNRAVQGVISSATDAAKEYALYRDRREKQIGDQTYNGPGLAEINEAWPEIRATEYFPGTKEDGSDRKTVTDAFNKKWNEVVEKQTRGMSETARRAYMKAAIRSRDQFRATALNIDARNREVYNAGMDALAADNAYESAINNAVDGNTGRINVGQFDAGLYLNSVEQSMKAVPEELRPSNWQPGQAIPTDKDGRVDFKWGGKDDNEKLSAELLFRQTAGTKLDRWNKRLVDDLAAQYVDLTKTTDATKEDDEAKMREVAGRIFDPEDRERALSVIEAAKAGRDKAVAVEKARDNARASDLDELVGMSKASPEEITERNALLDKLGPIARRQHEERELNTRTFFEFANWEKANPIPEVKPDEKTEDVFARRKKARDAALALPTPEARALALRSIDRIFGPSERAYLDNVDAALDQMAKTGVWKGELLSVYDQREILRECAEKGLLQRGKASQYESLIEAQEKDPKKREDRAAAVRTALERYVPSDQLERLLSIDPNRGVVPAKNYDPSGKWSPGWTRKNRSNEVVRLIAESVVKFDRLRATGAIKADKTLDQFLEETVGKSDAYLDSRDDEIIGNISAAMLSLDAEETAENVRRSGGFRSLPIMDLR